MARPAKLLGLQGERLPSFLPLIGFVEIRERRRERRWIVDVLDDSDRVAEPFDGTIGRTRHDRQPRRCRLECHIRKRVVASRKHHRVDRSIEHVEVSPLAQETDAICDSELGRAALPRMAVIATCDP